MHRVAGHVVGPRLVPKFVSLSFLSETDNSHLLTEKLPKSSKLGNTAARAVRGEGGRMAARPRARSPLVATFCGPCKCDTAHERNIIEGTHMCNISQPILIPPFIIAK